MALIRVVVFSGVFVLIGVLVWRAKPNEEPAIGNNVPPEFMAPGRLVRRDPIEEMDKPWLNESWVADQLKPERHRPRAADAGRAAEVERKDA